MGCGTKRNQGGVVSGKITYKEKAVNGVKLQLYRLEGTGDPIVIPVSQEGTFHTSNIPPGEYKVVVEAPPSNAMLSVPKNVAPGKKEEMEQKLRQMQGQGAPTIAYPNKYKNVVTTDLKCKIELGEQPLNLELKD